MVSSGRGGSAERERIPGPEEIIPYDMTPHEISLTGERKKGPQNEGSSALVHRCKVALVTG